MLLAFAAAASSVAGWLLPRRQGGVELNEGRLVLGRVSVPAILVLVLDFQGMAGLWLDKGSGQAPRVCMVTRACHAMLCNCRKCKGARSGTLLTPALACDMR